MNHRPEPRRGQSPDPDPRPVRGAAGAALALLAYCTVALAALHVLRPGDDPATSFVSNYAVGPYGAVMTSFFVAFALALAALIRALACSGLRGAPGLLGLAALSVTAAGLIVTAIYPTDLPGAPFTRSGYIHEISFRVNVLGLLVGVLALSHALGRRPGWRPLRGRLWALAAAVLLVLVAQFATLRKGLPYGLVNRLLVLTVFAWLAQVAWRLRSGPPA